MRQKGITLLELLIAMILGLFVSMALVQLFTGTKHSYKLQEGNSRVQESGRFAADVLLRDIRLAGYAGCSGGELVTTKVVPATPDILRSFASSGLVIFGIDGADGSESDIAGNGYGEQAGTDILSVQTISDRGVGLVGSVIPINGNIVLAGKGPGFAANDQILVTNCSSADLMSASGVFVNGDGNTEITHAPDLSTVYGPGSIVVEPTVYSYFIRDTGRKDAAGNPISSLFRRDALGTDVEMMEGVSNMQLEFGLDEDGDRMADKYYGDSTAPNGHSYKVKSFGWDETSDEWDKVVSLRVTFIIQSVDYVHDALVKTYSATAAIRNRAM